MAERDIQAYQYAYTTNASQVIEPERERRLDKDAPSGAAESLVGHAIPKMGGRSVVVTNIDKSSEDKKEDLKRRRMVDGNGEKKRRRVGGISLNNKASSVLDVDEYSSRIYKPRSSKTEAKYYELLDIISKFYPDESGDILADVANEVLCILKSDEIRGRQERVEALLDRMNEREYGNLVFLSKEIDDFDATIIKSSNDEVIAMDMIASDEEDLEDVMSEEEGEGEGSDIEDGNVLKANDATMQIETDSTSLHISEIDSYWLQRKINEYIKDAVKSQDLAEQIVSIMMNDDEREREVHLADLIGNEYFELINLLLSNGKVIAYVTKWRQAQSDHDKNEITSMILNDPSVEGKEIIEALEGKGRVKGLKDQSMSSRRMKAHSEKDDEEALREEEKNALGLEMNVKPSNKKIDLAALELTSSSYLSNKRSIKLPKNSKRVLKPGYEEIHIPATANKYNDPAFVNSQRLVYIRDMPGWFQAGFGNTEKLNLVQSQIYESAMLSSENLLLCAPTGAGKTNVALMTILHEMWLHRREDGSVDRDKFKIVYIAPMKALVKEMVDNFGQRLKPYGITVRELSGDVNLTKEEISETQLIITTPEKWDIITRKSGDRTYTQLVRLIIIDEIHLLHDERGPVLESLVARTVRQIEMTQEMVRLVGLSATLPNYQDVATFLRVDPEKGLFFFDSSYRPVALKQQIIGVTEKSSLKCMKLMDEICYEKVMDKAGVKQVLVFVHSRKETAKTAQFLMDRSVEKDEHHRFFSHEEDRKRLEEKVKQYNIKNDELKKLLPGGFAIHHAGLCRSDRTAVEELFGQGLIQVLVSTMTLAWGVNLPAHTVIIKGTQMYSPEKSSWVELSPQDVLQMLGRAGRPQFEKEGEGIIITKSSEQQYYLSLMNAQLPIESQFIKKLADNMNAEIVMGTITTLEEAVSWLGYTYLYIRMLKNPVLYGCSAVDLESDPSLLQYRVDLAHAAAVLLNKNGLIKYDVKTGLFESTGLGRIASYYYISNNSVSVYNQHLKPSMNDIELFRLFSMSNEFSQITVRSEEKMELDMLMKRVPIPIRETVDQPISKVNVLLQSYISRVRLEKFAMACDMVYITQSAGRILRALFEIALLKGWSSLTQRCLEIGKMVAHQQWSIQSPLRQFGKLPAKVVKQLENKPISFERYYYMEPADFEELVSLRDHQVRDVGDKINQLVHELPRLSAEATILPITRTMISMELALTADFNYDHAIHGSSQGFHIIIEDSDGETIIYYQYWILKEKYAEEVHHINFTVPLFDPLPPQYFLRIISDSWLQAETTHLISLRSLILPEKFPAHTQLLDLQPLPLNSLNNPLFESLLEPTLTQFNSIQTQVFKTAYETDHNILLAARSGSGKGVIGELAMFRLASKQPEAKILYLCPVEDVCEQKKQRWSQMFGEGLGMKVGKLIGDAKLDTRTLRECNIIISLPEHMDYYTNRGRNLKLIQQIKLVIIDKLHFVNSPKGHLIEIVTSRLRAFEAQSKGNPDSPFSIQFRIVALSACLANANSLAGWLNVNHGLFSFHSSVMVNPVQVRVDSFDINHTGTRLLAMSKPVYSSITGLAGRNSTLVFVPSRKQAQMTAIDILTFVSNSVKPKRFNHIPEDEMETVLSHVVDPALKTVLEAGIGYFFKGMNTNDAQLVLELFKNDYIQILVAPYDLCWSFDLSVYLVIVMDTCFYDGKEHTYIDYPIYDILRMVGLASRPGKFPNGKAIIMTHVSKKAYFNKFLFEPLPIESSLHENLGDALNAAIVSEAVTSMQDAVEWITWFFFYRRLPQNPSYYSLEGISEELISEYISVLTENTVNDLAEAGLIDVDEDSLSCTNLGALSSHLYIHFRTTELFARSISEKTKRRGLLKTLASATEFENISLRQHEQLQLSRMEKHLSYVVEKTSLSAYKVNILLQAYFSREAISNDMRMDTLALLPTALRLLHGMINVCSTNSWLKPAIAAIELCQMIVQGAWNEDSRLLQLPHFDKERSRMFETEGVDNIFDFLDMEDDVRKGLLSGLSDKEIEDIVEYCNEYPDIEVKPTMEETVGIEEEGVIEVEFIGGEEETTFNTKVTSNSYPQELNASWWLILGNPDENIIYSITEVDLQRTNRKAVHFTTPSEPGHYTWKLYFMTDSYIGCDQEQDIEFDVVERN